MNKTELVNEIAKESELTRKDSKLALESILKIIGDKLATGEKVRISGFGTFEPRERAKRNGVNPQTKEKITIAPCTSAGFKVSKRLKERINK